MLKSPPEPVHINKNQYVMTPKSAVPVSGTGTILEAMIQRGLPISLVIADRPCRGAEIAQAAKIQTHILPRIFKKDFDRYEFTLDFMRLLDGHRIGLVAMAGFMTIFDKIIFSYYGGRITNIHPALLPSFKGDHAVRDALAFGVKVTGTTIHFATAELDTGPIIAQEAVPVIEGDTVETLHERIKLVERRLYPEVVSKLLQTISC